MITKLLGLSLALLLLVCCNSHKKDAGTDSASSSTRIDTVKTDSGISIVKTAEGKVIKSFPTDSGTQSTRTESSANSFHGVDTRMYPFLVRGTLIHGEGGNITLDKIGTGKDIKPLEVVTADDKGNFAFVSTCSQPEIMQLRLPAGNIQFVARPRDTINFTITLEDPGDYKVTGSPESVQLKKMFLILVKANEEKQVIEDRLKASQKNMKLYSHLIDLRPGQYKEIDVRKGENLKKYIKLVDTSYVALFAAQYLDPDKEYTLLKKLDKKFVFKYPGTKLYRSLHEKVQIYAPIAIGAKAPEIISQTPDGKTVKLSSFKGKYILLYFWAPNNFQCKEETAFIRKAFDKFKSKGLEVVSYAIERDKNLWGKAIADEKMDWTNISDLLSYSAAAASDYIVTEVPTAFLIDPDGRIVAKHIKGPDLDNTLSGFIK